MTAVKRQNSGAAGANSPKKAKTDSEQSSTAKENRSPQQLQDKAKSPSQSQSTGGPSDGLRNKSNESETAAKSPKQQSNAEKETVKSPKQQPKEKEEPVKSPKQSSKQVEQQKTAKSPKQSVKQDADAKSPKQTAKQTEQAKSPKQSPQKKSEKNEEQISDETDDDKSKGKQKQSAKTVNGSPSHQSSGDLSDFQKRVFAAVNKIPKGKVATYHVIAEMINEPSASYSVGNALHHCPDLSVPVHRIVTADGKIAVGGKSGNAGESKGQVSNNTDKLSAEGIKVDSNGKIDNFEQHLYHPKK